jgi:phosphonate transport system substrate-binding protein
MTANGPNRARRLGLAALLAWLGLPLHAAVTGGTPLRLGLAPYLSPGALLAAFRSLREHLERTLDRPIEMVTAKDFVALVTATQRGDYDAVLLPAHVARLAISDWRFEPLARTLETVHVVVLVRADGPVRSAADLRGGKAGMLDTLSLTASVGRQWLQDQGLADDVTVVALPSINSALISLDRSEVAMVVAGSSQLLNLPAGTPRSARVLATVRDIPGPIYVARPGMPPADLASLRAALLAFRPDPARPDTAANAALQPVTNDDLDRLEPFAAQARRALAQRP